MIAGAALERRGVRVAQRQKAAEQEKCTNEELQRLAYVLTTPRLNDRQRLLARKLAEMPMGCLAPIDTRQDDRFTPR